MAMSQATNKMHLHQINAARCAHESRGLGERETKGSDEAGPDPKSRWHPLFPTRCPLCPMPQPPAPEEKPYEEQGRGGWQQQRCCHPAPVRLLPAR
jgi:hypothetical protein